MKKIFIFTIILILSSGCNRLNKKEQKEFIGAILKDDVKKISHFIETRNLDINDENIVDGVLLQIAARYDANNVVDYLIKKGANVNKADNNDMSTPIMHSSNAEITKKLIINGANVNIRDKEGQNALHYHAGIRQHTDIIKILLKHKIDINAKTYNKAKWIWSGQTPIFNTINFSLYDHFLLLVNNGADLKIIDDKRNNLLHYSIFLGDDIRITKFLIRNGVSLKHKNKNGETPFFYFTARRINNKKRKAAAKNLLKFLLKNNLNINIKNNNGNTVLHNAVKLREIFHIKMLLKNGADKNIKNNRGQTPLDLALKYNPKNKEIINLLK